MPTKNQLQEENEKLKEEIDDIYNKLRAAEGIKELMTDREGIAEAVSDYVSGFHKQQDEIEELKEDIEECSENFKEEREVNEKLRNLIPDKKGKKLSQNDKEVLKGIIESIEIGQGSSTDQEYNLLNRLLK